MIVRVQSIALTAGVSASHDAGNAVDHEVGADLNGHRSPKIAGPARTRRSLRSDKCASASPGRRAKYKKIRPTVAVERTAKATKAKTTMGAPNGDVREPLRRRRSGSGCLRIPTVAASHGLSCSRRAVNFLVTAPYAGSGKSPRSRPPCPRQRRGSKPCRRCSAGTSLPISGCLAPSRRGNAPLRSPTSADAPEQPVLDVRNQPDSHRRRRTEQRLLLRA